MNIEIFRLAVDFGLMVLIWMVQLLIYPGFEFLNKDTFHDWHRKYARNMTFIVAPLMFAQVFMVVYFFYFHAPQFATNVIYATLVALTWISTFLIFIPLHNKLDNEPHNVDTCCKLTQHNWIRVILWTGIVLLDIYLLYKPF
ncbi:MAG: hypothetical protein WBG46_11590 [Nonlabens sp.]